MSKKNLTQLGISLIIGAAVVVVLLVLRSFHLLDTLELKTMDYRFVLRGPYTGILSHTDLTADSLDVVLVDLDDESWRLIPYKWPYPREVWAHVVRNLTRAGAKTIVFDIEFDTEDAKSAVGDSIFAASIRKAKSQGTQVVLAAKFVTEKTRQPPEYVQKPVPAIMAANPEIGLINERKDLDGFSRRYIIFHYLPDENKAYLSLATKAAATYLGIPDSTTISQSNGFVDYGPLHIRSFHHPALMLINFYGPPSNGGPPPTFGPWRTFLRYPLSSVLDDSNFDLKVPEEDTNWMELFFNDGMMKQFGLQEESPFQGKIVVVGVSLDDFHDVKETPYFNFAGYQNLMPGMETHANAIQMILDNNYIKAISDWKTIAILIILVVITAIVITIAKPLLGGIISLGISWLYVDLAFGAFFQNYIWSFGKLYQWTFGQIHALSSLGNSIGLSGNITPPSFGTSVYIPVIIPVLGVMLTYGANVVYQFVAEQREKRWVKDAFGHFLSPKVIGELMKDPGRLSLGGERRELTVLFSDIEGFTTVSEKMKPELLVEFLNEYLSEMTDVILDHEGIIDKYEGDAIMAEFGAPLQTDDHALKACNTAIEMQLRLEKLREKWTEKDLPSIHTRIGINSGVMALGNFGSKDVFDYTVMGDAVNIGARLEGANKIYGTYMMISSTTYEEVKNQFKTRYLDKLLVKGKTEPVTVYELLGRTDNVMPLLSDAALLEPYNQGITHYFNQEWKLAIQSFQEALSIDPDDGPSKLYLNRCREYQQSPPPENWDGVYRMTSK